MLTDKEKQEIQDLRIGFNVVKESPDYNSLTNRRVDISRVTAKRLLKLSLIFNCLSILAFIFIILFAFLKPTPSYYASTPSGKVFGPLLKEKLK